MRKILVLAIVFAIACFAQGVAAQQSDFQVVIHPDNPSDSLPASQVAKLFLKQSTSWSHGGKVQPVDQAESSAARSRFSDEILSRTVPAVESYWQQQIYSGRAVPPVKVGSDSEVIAFVKSNPGAIGYVSASANTSGVKTVSVN